MNLILFVNGNGVCITMIVIINLLIGNKYIAFEWLPIGGLICMYVYFQTIIAKSERPLKCKNKKSTKNLIIN